MQRIQYAKTKSDCVAKADGSYVPGDKKRKQEEKCELKEFSNFHPTIFLSPFCCFPLLFVPTAICFVFVFPILYVCNIRETIFE